MIPATVALTCTSNATNVLACAMVDTPMIAVPAEAKPAHLMRWFRPSQHARTKRLPIRTTGHTV
jgi:hypothetical protein